MHLRPGRAPARVLAHRPAGKWDPPARDEAGRELVKRYRHLYGESSAAHFTEWAGLAKPHAQALWELSRAKGGGEELKGVRLLGPGDPQLQRRDRETLVPDAAWRKQVWKAVGGAGVVTQDGKAVALWRARKQGKTLEVTSTAATSTCRRRPTGSPRTGAVRRRSFGSRLAARTGPRSRTTPQAVERWLSETEQGGMSKLISRVRMRLAELQA